MGWQPLGAGVGSLASSTEGGGSRTFVEERRKWAVASECALLASASDVSQARGSQPALQ